MVDSARGKYHWSEIHLQTFNPKWSRHMMVIENDGEFCGKLNRWYHVKADRLRNMLRLWVDGVPICERQIATPPPKKVWPVLGADANTRRQMT